MAVYTDNFNRADGGLGSNWTAPNVSIASNAVLPVLGSYQGCRARWTANSVGADQYSKAKFLVASYPSFPSVIVRSDAPGNLYFFNREGALADANEYGGATTFGSCSATAANDVVSLEISGQDLVVKVNGTQVLAVTNSAHSAGAVGFTVASADATPSTVQLDDWEGGDLAAAGPAIPVFINQYRQRWN